MVPSLGVGRSHDVLPRGVTVARDEEDGSMRAVIVEYTSASCGLISCFSLGCNCGRQSRLDRDSRTVVSSLERKLSTECSTAHGHSVRA